MTRWLSEVPSKLDYSAILWILTDKQTDTQSSCAGHKDISSVKSTHGPWRAMAHYGVDVGTYLQALHLNSKVLGHKLTKRVLVSLIAGWLGLIVQIPLDFWHHMIVSTQSLFLSPGPTEETTAFPFRRCSGICLSPLSPMSLALVTGSYGGSPTVPPRRAKISRDRDPTARGVPHSSGTLRLQQRRHQKVPNSLNSCWEGYFTIFSYYLQAWRCFG